MFVNQNNSYKKLFHGKSPESDNLDKNTTLQDGFTKNSYNFKRMTKQVFKPHSGRSSEGPDKMQANNHPADSVPKHHRDKINLFETEMNFDHLTLILNEIEKSIFRTKVSKTEFDCLSDEGCRASFRRRSINFSDFSKQKQIINNPLGKLLFWAAMLGNFQIVEVIYKHLAKYEGSGMMSALILAAIFKKAEEIHTESEFIEQLSEQSEKYEQIAVSILNIAYRKSNSKASILCGLTYPNWGGLSPMDVALIANLTIFVSQEGFQSYLDNLWYYKLKPIKNFIRFLMLPFMIPLAWFPGVLSTMNFRNIDKLGNIDHSEDSDRQNKILNRSASKSYFDSQSKLAQAGFANLDHSKEVEIVNRSSALYNFVKLNKSKSKKKLNESPDKNETNLDHENLLVFGW